MGTLVDKLNYLLTTKNQLKTILENKGAVNTTVFRDYPTFVDNKIDNLIDTAVTTCTPISSLQFSKTDVGIDGEGIETVTLPHTCNVNDCTSDSMYRGSSFYYYSLTLTELTALDKYYLKLEQAVQCATVYVNGTNVGYHSAGYAPYTVELTGLVVGDNIIKIKCDNSINYDIIPLSADFSFVNGIIGLADIIHVKGIFFDPITYGIDKCHFVPKNISASLATATVKTALSNCSTTTECIVNVTINLLDANNNNAITAITDKVKIGVNETVAYSKEFDLVNPHLWNGKTDPYLYTLQVVLSYNNTTLETLNVPVGFRKILSDHNSGVYLNGTLIQLFGACMHQDSADHSQALTHTDYDTKVASVVEYGAPMLRLAHYPHNPYMYHLTDTNGILVQAEIPWVNNCPANCSDNYKASIITYVHDMIINLYNHCSIMLWGLSNELGGNHLPISSSVLGGYSKDLAVSLQNEAYAYARILEPIYRPVGYSTTKNSLCKDFSSDWVAFNSYGLWYNTDANTMQNGASTVYNYYKLFGGVSEYGAGGDWRQQSENWRTDTNIGAGGALHYESYQTYVHEFHLNKLIELGSMLSYATLWTYADFASYKRTEGYENGINDKGVISRDLTVKKDSWWLYHTYYNRNNSDTNPIVYITDKRLSARTTNFITIKAYSNCDYVELWSNGYLLQTLTAPTDATNNIIWTFDPVQFWSQEDVYTVKGYVDGVEVDSDSNTFTTTSPEVLSGYNYVTSDTSSIQVDAVPTTPAVLININTNNNWVITSDQSWVTVSPASGTITTAGVQEQVEISIFIGNNTTATNRTAILTCAPADGLEGLSSSSEIQVTQLGVEIEDSVDYLSITSEGYFNTLLRNSTRTRVEAQFYIPHSTTGTVSLFGTASPGDTGIGLEMNLDTCVATVRCGDNEEYTFSYTEAVNNLYTIVWTSTGCSINDDSVSYTISYSSGTYVYWLCGTNNGLSLNNPLPVGCRIYYARFINNYVTPNVTLLDLVTIIDDKGVPCLQDSLTENNYYFINGTVATAELDGHCILNPTSGTIAGVDGSIDVVVDATYGTTYLCESDWVTITYDSATTTYTFTGSDNTLAVSRVATIYIKSGMSVAQFALTQQAGSNTADYQDVSYLTSNAATHPYILTSIVPTADMTIEVKGYFSNYNGTALLGSRVNSSTLRCDLVANDDAAIYACFPAGPSKLKTYTSSNLTLYSSPHVYKFNVTNFYIDNSVHAMDGTSTPSAFTSTIPFMLFADNTDGTASNQGHDRTIYYCKFWQGETLIAEFIPRLDANGVACMYETVSETYYYSQNSGTFSYGIE